MADAEGWQAQVGGVSAKGSSPQTNLSSLDSLLSELPEQPGRGSRIAIVGPGGRQLGRSMTQAESVWRTCIRPSANTAWRGKEYRVHAKSTAAMEVYLDEQLVYQGGEERGVFAISLAH